jgi:3-isopropylmalate/(R)-2-methylmalate dehydratase small subunit
MRVTGRALKYGNDINTDLIIPGRFLHIYDYDELAECAMADLDPEFHERFSKGDIIVAGNNFGCGSSREQAAICLRYAGVGAIVASSFARIFFRNAINQGIPIIEADTTGISTGDSLEVDLGSGMVRNLTTNTDVAGKQIPEFLIQLIEAGGLIPFVQRNDDGN